YGARPAKASVTVYIESRKDPGNAIRIKEIYDEIQTFLREIEILKKDINVLKWKSELAQSKIMKIRESFLSKSEEIATSTSTKEEIEKCNALILENEHNLKKVQLEVSGLINKFEEEKKKNTALIEIVRLLGFHSVLVDNFILEYEKFIEELKKFT